MPIPVKLEPRRAFLFLRGEPDRRPESIEIHLIEVNRPGFGQTIHICPKSQLERGLLKNNC
jgi:hypothetical protein